MCGISGQIDFSSKKNFIKDMTQRLVNRGPDDLGYYTYKEKEFSLNFGHTRLEILDIYNGKQPMISQDENNVIIFNGEIYNWRDIRTKLEELGYIFKSNNSDTEVLLIGYRHWGEKISEHLNGMWSFCIFDKKKKILFLSRDRFGEKPLYFYHKNNSFVFSSQIDSIIENKNENFSISEINLSKYCAYGYFPKDLTPFKDIKKICPGSNLTLNLRNQQKFFYTYWSFNLNPDYSKKETYWTEKLYFLMEKSVKDRLVADTEVGIFLSGGLDSSIIASLASKNSQKKINTFSIGFKEKSFDESKYSYLISNKLKTNHHNLIIDHELTKNNLDELFEKIDEPISDSSLISYYTLCKFASKHNKVVLGGDASDELFLGYDTFKALKYAKIMKNLRLNNFNPIFRFLINILPLSERNMNIAFKLKRFLMDNFQDLDLLNCKWLSPLSKDMINDIFNQNYTYKDIFSEAIEEWDNLKLLNLNYEEKSMHFYNKFFLANQMLVKVDRLSMMNGLEVRSPFLDYEFVDCVLTIPTEYKLKNNTGKYILKKTFEKLCGKEIVYRKKIGFTFPLEKYFQNKLINFELNSKYLKEKNIYIKLAKYNNLDRMVKWNLLNLDNFAKKYI